MASHAGKTVAEILKGKRASIKKAPLEEGAPGWDDIPDLTWEEDEEKARRGEPGFRTFPKLVKRKRFDK